MLNNNFSDEYLNTILDDGLTVREHMEIGYKDAINKQKQSNNPKFHRTFEQQELSFGFSQKYNEKIKKFENEIYISKDNTLEYDENNKFSILLAIQKCNNSIKAYYKLKDFCYKSYAGKIYFQDTWEYCHNSNCECFEYIRNIERIKSNLIKLLKK